MAARWTKECLPYAEKLIGHTIVASWWPGRYYCVLTFRSDTTGPQGKLIYALENKTKFEDVGFAILGYATTVNRCDKCGIATSKTPLYEREYKELSEAEAGHKEAVELIASGRLAFGR
jgi:hypothetical protein